MQIWNDLVKTALIGTERQKPPLSGEDFAELQGLLGQLDESDRERALLKASGMCTLARRAGYLTEAAGEKSVSKAEMDDLPLCRRAAMNDLAVILSGSFDALLPEWLRLVSERGERAWDRWLPELLDRGARGGVLREGIRAVIGKRGRWLAGQNPAWSYGLSAGPESGVAAEETVWERGRREERAGYLRALRGVNPALARQKLEAVWAQEPPEERAAFIGTFLIGLSAGDEPFLEAVLDDKRKEVRSAAQNLLRRLPESRLRQRMTERASALVTADRSLLSRTIAVTLPPEKFDRAWARDGIEPKPTANSKEGERAFQLGQVLSATPLRFWEEHLGALPEKLIAMAVTNKDWQELLLKGWTRALNLEAGFSPWAEPLLRHWLSAPNGPSDVDWERVLPKARLEEMFEEAFKIEILADPASLMRPLLVAPGVTWGRKLASRILAGFRVLAANPGDYRYIYALEAFADSFPDDMLDELYAVWTRLVGEIEYRRQEIARHIARTEFRRQMRRHISGE